MSVKTCLECGGPIPEDKHANTRICGDTCRKARNVKRQRQWVKENPDYRKQHYQRNKEHVSRVKKIYRESHREASREQSRRWREENSERHRYLCKRWVKNNPERVRAWVNKRRALKASAFVEDVDIAVLLERDGKVCHICGGEIDPCLSWPDTSSVSVDHVKPLSKGGEHSYANCKSAHLGCNMSKGNKVDFELSKE